MNPVDFADFVAVAAYLAAGLIVACMGANLPRDFRWMLVLLLAVGGAVALVSALGSMTENLPLDSLSALLRMLQPLTWGGLLYVHVQRAEREARDRQDALLHAALEGGELGIWDWEIATGQVNWSEITDEIHGVVPQTRRSRIEGWEQLVYEDDRAAMWADVERAFEQEVPYRSRYRIVRADGALRFVEGTGRVLRDPDGEPVRMVGTVRDVTEEHMLHQERARLAEMVDATSDYACMARVDGEIVYMNVAVRGLLGLPEDRQLAGMNLSALYAGRFAADIFATGIPAALRDGTWSGEAVVLSGDGREIPVSQVIVADRAREHVSLVLRDLSERERAAAQLRASEARYRDFISATADWVWETGPDLRFRDFSPRIEVFTGLPRSEFIGRTRQEIGDFEGEEEMLAQHLADLEARREFRDFRYRSTGSDGGVRWYESSGRPVYDEAGRFEGYRGTSRDITAQVEAVEALRESEARFRGLIEDSIEGVLIHRDFKPLFANQAYASMHGYDDPRDIVNLPSIAVLFAPGEIERLREYSTARLAGTKDAPAVYEYRASRRDGQQVVLQNTARRVLWQGLPAIQSVTVDVTERQRTEDALRDSEARYRALYDDNPSTYVTLDEQGMIRSINRHGVEQLGYRPGDLDQTDARTLYPLAERTAFSRFLHECLQAPGVVQHWELPKVKADGSILWARETARAAPDHDHEGKLVVLIVSEDVSEAHDLSERLAYEASHDGLTGLINRREFEMRLARVIDTTRGGESEHALCYFDLDQFKVVNDTSGHMAGDELLRQLGALFKDNVRRRDTLARLGGDEFALLIEHCPMSQALRVANNLQRAVSDFRFRWETNTFAVGVSIGVVPIDAASPAAVHVLGLADQACYVAKDQGRNRVHAYRADDIEIVRRTGEMQWIARLGNALDAGRFRLARQPIAALNASPKGEHYELLVRMVAEDGSLIAPGAFLPAAERYQIATRIDRWVVGAALDWLTGSPGELERLYLCAINLSGQSLGDAAFLAHVLERIRASGVPPEKLCFEITETAAIVNFAGAHDFINALRVLGCRFALDDFGSGLSSFGYLKTLPVDFLKIDGTFVKDIAEDPIDLAMVEAINRIGQVIGKQTVAEFVESEAILERLRELGVDYAQGYHLGRPEIIEMPPIE